MEGSIYQDKINQCKAYCRGFIKFEKYLKEIYYNLQEKSQMHRGYLIDLKEFDQCKNDILYQDYKNDIKEYDDKINVKIFALSTIDKSFELKKFEQVKIESYQELKDKLFNNNEYLLINTELWYNICKFEKENESYIKYYINNSELYFILNDNHSIHFKHNNNILNKASYISIDDDKIVETSKNRNIDINVTIDNEYNVEEVNNNDQNNIFQNEGNNDNKEKLSKLIDIMMEYYLFEKKLKDDTKSLAEDITNSGYLIDKKIIDNWKNATNYEKIKEIFFLEYFQNNNSILTKELKDKILNFMTNNNNKFEFNNIKIKSLTHLTIEEFQIFTKTNSFVLIHKNLFEMMKDKKENNESPIEYKILINKIKFILKNANFEFYINNNIIFSDFETYFLFLIKLFLFQEDFRNKTIVENEKKNNTFVMIDKDIISKIKQNFNYDALCKYIQNVTLNHKENNKSINIEKIYEIIQILPKEYINSINKNFDINKINFDLSKKMIKEKIIEDGQNMKIFKYNDNFEIINVEISLMLKGIFNDIKKYFNYGRFYFLTLMNLVLLE